MYENLLNLSARIDEIRNRSSNSNEQQLRLFEIQDEYYPDEILVYPDLNNN